MADTSCLVCDMRGFPQLGWSDLIKVIEGAWNKRRTKTNEYKIKSIHKVQLVHMYIHKHKSTQWIYVDLAKGTAGQGLLYSLHLFLSTATEPDDANSYNMVPSTCTVCTVLALIHSIIYWSVLEIMSPDYPEP